MWPRLLLIAVLFVVSSCAHQSSVDRLEFIVASQTVALDKRPWQGKGNLAPWEKRERVESDGTVSIFVSNSCGFVDVTYRAQTLTNYLTDREPLLHDIGVIDSMGEWCGVRRMIIDTDTLLLLRYWRGKRYVEGSAAIFRDHLERPFIVDAGFIESADLERLVALLNLEQPSGGCYARWELTSEFVEELRAEAAVVETSDGMCFERGIYLQQLLTTPSAFPQQ